jgi:2-dehydropantoate 2-reductase
MQRECQADHTAGLRDLGSATCNPCAGGAAANEQRQAGPAERRCLITAQQGSNHGQPRLVKLPSGRGRAPPRHPIRLLDQRDRDPVVKRRRGRRLQIGRIDPTAGAVAEHQQRLRPAGRVQPRAGWTELCAYVHTPVFSRLLEFDAMRFVIYGAGAVGGVIGARLFQSGQETLLIARGAHHDRIKADGLRLRTPLEDVTLQIPVARDPAAAEIGTGDVVLLCVKGQDTESALRDLRDVAAGDIPVVCMQNGVANERVALRMFADVYGAVVLCPAGYMEPGVVEAYATTVTGTLDLGRYPTGSDRLCEQIAEALRGSQFEASARPDIMRSKYAKLIANLGNAVQVLCGDGNAPELLAQARAEGKQILMAAGIAHDAESVTDIEARWARWDVRQIDGQDHASSTLQSVLRGSGVEVDFLNGEIVLQARLLGLEAPINELLQGLVHATVRAGRQPGWLSQQEILGQLAAA